MDQAETTTLLRVLGAAYQGTTVDAEVVSVWANHLATTDADLAHAVAVEWVEYERHFPRISEFQDRLTGEARRRSAGRMLANAPCTACESGWVPVENAAQQRVAVRPCRTCNPKGYERWAGGHYMPNHSCGECEDLKRGRRVG